MGSDSRLPLTAIYNSPYTSSHEPWLLSAIFDSSFATPASANSSSGGLHLYPWYPQAPPSGIDPSAIVTEQCQPFFALDRRLRIAPSHIVGETRRLSHLGALRRSDASCSWPGGLSRSPGNGKADGRC